MITTSPAPGLTDSRNALPDAAAEPRWGRAQAALLCLVVGAVTAGVLAYGQTIAWYEDEGFHLLAAMLINAGKKPYLDFFYPQPPLYAYLNAAWMRLFGETWRSAHAFSALLTGAAVGLVAGYVFSRLRQPGWQLAGGITAALLTGWSFLVIQFGTVGQAYGLCLFLVMAAFRLGIAAMDRTSGLLSFAAGLCAGAAAASSLLSVPVAPILLLWSVYYSPAGIRRKRAALFMTGAAVPFLPFLGLLLLAPRQVVFNVFEYHLLYRRLGYGSNYNIDLADLRVLSGWLNSAHNTLLVMLAAIGLLFLTSGRHSEDRKPELYLCAWLAAGLGVYLATARPTFSQYFILLIPFLSILAWIGVYAIGSRIGSPDRPFLPVAAVIILLALGLGKSIYQSRHDFPSGSFWLSLEGLAREINRVTPPHGLIHANESTYFASRRLPPPGMEHSDAYKLRLPPAFADSLHVLPGTRVDEWLAQGRFDTAVMWEQDPRVDSFQMSALYRRWSQVAGYYIFSDRVVRRNASQ